MAAEFTGRAFNMDTVAQRLDVKRRFLLDWLRNNKWDDQGRPYYSAIAGKKKLFTEADIARIFAALPKPEPIPARVATLGLQPGMAPRGKRSQAALAELMARLNEGKSKRRKGGARDDPIS